MTSTENKTGTWKGSPPDGDALAMLQRHNSTWNLRRKLWLRYAIPPWWEKGLVISPEIRAVYESWLPISDFRRTLNAVCRAYLPDEDWIPLPLALPVHQSLPDLWATLPEQFASRTEFQPGELLPLLCALADPSRFGTAEGRYPEQTAAFLSMLKPDSEIRILDIGCGTGLNTMEIIRGAAKQVSRVNCTAVTSSHLEVWMAQNKTAPHNPALDAAAAYSCPQNAEVLFLQGDAAALDSILVHEPPFDFIFCNGLAGGRFFHSQEQYQAFLNFLHSKLTVSGTVFLANKFHDGCKPWTYNLLKTATEYNFSVSGTWNNAMLKICSAVL